MMLLIYQREAILKKIQMPGIRILIMMAGFILIAVTGTELILYSQSILFSKQYIALAGGTDYFLNIVVVLVAGLPMYVYEELKANMRNQVLQQQYDLLQMKQLKTLSDLETLRAKINPHFLYNVHNTIVGLIKEEPEKAEKMTILLSKFFRSTLDNDSSTYHTVADEMEIVRTYLDMQAIRYSERLRIVYDIDNATLKKQIPSFIIQPLVENAIKHGIEKSSKKGLIIIEIKQEINAIAIRVKDSGPEFPELLAPGTGQKIVISKLNLLCKNKYELNFVSTPEKFVEIKLYPDAYGYNR